MVDVVLMNKSIGCWKRCFNPIGCWKIKSLHPGGMEHGTGILQVPGLEVFRV